MFKHSELQKNIETRLLNFSCLSSIGIKSIVIKVFITLNKLLESYLKTGICGEKSIAILYLCK